MVVWWSPFDLSLNAQPAFGIRRQELIVKDVPPPVLKAYRSDYEQWRSARASAVDRARRPSIAVITATEAAARAPDGTPALFAGLKQTTEDLAVSVEYVEPLGERPGGVRFGTLVHALLADVPLVDGEEVLDRLADAHARVLGATAPERTAARELVSRTLAHPVILAAARAASAGQCYRETPVTLRVDDRTVVEGQVDLVFAEGDEFVVVDFKTDRDRQGTLDQYRAQVGIYAAAVSQATGRRARGVLMNL